MLFLLRNIRRKLMEKNKVTTYLLYALGEILLVVVGILIAVQIDQSRQQKNELMVEQSYLHRLQLDLEKDLIDIDSELNYRLDKKEVAIKMTAEFNGLTYSMKRPIEANRAKMLIYTWAQFYPNNNTYLELLSTGYLNLIRSDSIKTAFFELQKKWSHLDREYHTINEFRNKYILEPGMTLGIQAPGNLIEIADSDSTSSLKISDSQRQEMLKQNQKSKEAVQSNLTFQNGVSIEILLNKTLIEMLEDYKSQVEKTLILIEAEMSK